MFLFPRPHPLERGRTFRDLRRRLGPPAFFLPIFVFAAIRSLAPTLDSLSWLPEQRNGWFSLRHSLILCSARTSFSIRLASRFVSRAICRRFDLEEAIIPIHRQARIPKNGNFGESW